MRSARTLLVCLLLATPAGLAMAQGEVEGVAVPAPPEAAAAAALAATEQYVIGVEDVLEVTVWKNPDLSKRVPVRPDGKITLPLIDDIVAVGKTPSQLKQDLTEKWRAFITAPEVSVIVAEVNSLKVYMVGEITNPGILNLKSRTTLLQALSLAGGFTTFADKSKIIVLRATRDGQTRMEINYKKIISGDAVESNIVLHPGDTVIVP